jgi:hypothetical protein
MNPTPPSIRRLTVLTVITGGLRAANCVLTPNLVPITLVCVAMMVWMCILAHRKLRSTDPEVDGASSRVRAHVREYEWAGFLMVGVLASNVVRSLGVADGDGVDRAVGVMFGTFGVACANVIPKRSGGTGPPSGASYDIRRFAGWVFTIYSLTYIAVYVFAPLDIAPKVLLAAGLGGLAIIAVRIATRWGSPRRTH